MHSNTGYIMTVANSIIGVGILAMPFCFMKCGIFLSIILLIISNLVTRIACHYLLKTSIKARRKNFEFLASYIFGSSGKLMVELCVIGYLMGTCITYFVVVGDLGPQIIAKLFDINQTDSLRTSVMVIVTVFCIIPLGLLRNIESLSSVCISSILFYFCLVLKIFFESESKISTSYWYENVYWWRPSGITQCLPIFSMALSCQMQIFEVYESLPNQTLEKMNEIIKFGTAICTGVYILVGFFGYVAFSDQKFSGNILISLTPSVASDIIKMGFVLSIAVSFPLVIFPCRASLYSLLYHRSHSDTAHYIPEHRFKYITISLVLIGLFIGILIPSVELVIGLVGSTIGVAICIMFPASCFIKTNKKNSTEKLTAQFLLVFGFIIMILGTYANLGAIDEQQSGVETIQIEKKPDIPLSAEKPIIPTKFDVPNIVQNDPDKDKPVVDNDVPLSKLKIPKRKPIKTSKTQVDSQQPVREIVLEEKTIDLNKFPKPIESLNNDDSKKSNVAEKIEEKPKIIEEKPLKEPSIQNKASETMINKDAIQKEEQEIAIDAKESEKKEIERTREILVGVQAELAKQNERAQKLVMEKIDKISQQVNNIEKMRKDELRSDTESKKNQNDQTVQSAIVINDKSNLIETKNDEQIQKLLEPPVPLFKLLDKKLNLTQQKDIVPGEPKEIPTNLTDLKKEFLIAKPAKIDTVNDVENINAKKENIGRDLLSDTIDLPDDQQESGNLHR